jgi:tetratricopeptide (TPR) repeat protein
VDSDGKPVAGVTIKATMPRAGNRGPESKANAKGEWAVGGIAGGEWALEFTSDGFETRTITVAVMEASRLPPMEIRLTRLAPPVADPNVEIREKLLEAADLMNTKQFGQARAIYEDLAAKHPQVKQFRPLIARSYYGEGNKKAAIEHLRKALADDPANVEVTLLLGNTLMEEGHADEARQILASIDESKITDPTVLLNAGIALLNDKKHDEAVQWFDKAVARFPSHPDGYYYRGITYLSLGKTPEAKADLQKYVSMAPADAPELATAKKILESLK